MEDNFPEGIGILTCENGNWNNYGKIREGITRLNINRLGLEGELDLTDFKNLVALKCSFNQLTYLKLSNLNQLRWLICDNNLLTDLETTGLSNLQLLFCVKNYLTDISSLLSNLNPKRMTDIRISNNNFPPSELWPFSKFIRVRVLFIGNDDNYDRKNRFHGSLEPLKDLTELNYLNIAKTDIDSGLEYLPDSLNALCCSDTELGVELKKMQKFMSEEKGISIKESWSTRASSLGDEWTQFSAEGLEIVKSRAEICSLKSEVEALENELEIEQDHAKNMDKWYKNQLDNQKQEKFIELRNKILELEWREREKDEEIKNLKENIATISQIVEKEYQLRATSAKIIRALEKKNANYQRAGMIGITVVGVIMIVLLLWKKKKTNEKSLSYLWILQ